MNKKLWKIKRSAKNKEIKMKKDKKFKQLKRFDKVEVEWLDATFTNGWLNENELDWNFQEDCAVHLTCGYFLKETDKLIVIVQSIRKLSLKEEGAYVDSVMKIPKVSVLKVSVLNQAIKIKNNKGRVKT